MLGQAPKLDDLRGLAKTRPLEATALAIGLLSLAGLPAAGGFIAKLYLFKSLVVTSSWILLGIAAFGAALGFYYYARFFTAPFLGQSHVEPAPRHRLDRVLLIFCAMLILLFGFEPVLLVNAVTMALTVR
jgi:NADH-quinone oxidoreductase subunit N